MKFSLLNKNFSKKGFTLIEILVVIAVLGVLAVATLAAINPIKRVNQAKDAQIKNDIGQISRALQAEYTASLASGTGYYPRNVSDISGSGKTFVSEPKTPGGSSYGMSGATSGSAACTTAGQNCVNVTVYSQLNDGSQYHCWQSSDNTFKTSASQPAATAVSCP